MLVVLANSRILGHVVRCVAQAHVEKVRIPPNATSLSNDLISHFDG